MANPNILEETPMSMAEMKNELSKIKKRDKELNFRSNKTDEYLKQFTLVDSKVAQEISEKLEKLNIPRLKELHIKKIVDIMPGTAEEVKAVLEAYPITITNDNLKKIAKVVSEFIKDR
jgi:DNA-directed RNA polymerase subunit F